MMILDFTPVFLVLIIVAVALTIIVCFLIMHGGSMSFRGKEILSFSPNDKKEPKAYDLSVEELPLCEEELEYSLKNTTKKS